MKTMFFKWGLTLLAVMSFILAFRSYGERAWEPRFLLLGMVLLGLSLIRSPKKSH